MVQYNGISRAFVTVDNLNDNARKYDVDAKAWVNENGPDAIEQGHVKNENGAIATFYYYNDTNLSVNFMCDAEMQEEVLAEVHKFVADAKTLGGVATL